MLLLRQEKQGKIAKDKHTLMNIYICTNRYIIFRMMVQCPRQSNKMLQKSGLRPSLLCLVTWQELLGSAHQQETFPEIGHHNSRGHLFSWPTPYINGYNGISL